MVVVRWLGCTRASQRRPGRCGYETGRHITPPSFYLSILISFVDNNCKVFRKIIKEYAKDDGVSDGDCNNYDELQYVYVKHSNSCGRYGHMFDMSRESLPTFSTITRSIRIRTRRGHTYCTFLSKLTSLIHYGNFNFK